MAEEKEKNGKNMIISWISGLLVHTAAKIPRIAPD